MTEEQISISTKYVHIMLDQAEGMFGKRDESWTYIGVEFQSDGPYICYYPRKRVSVVLLSGCSEYPFQYYFELAHEVCHLLYPTGKRDANVLNEGLSAYFQVHYLKQMYPGSTLAIDLIRKSKYHRAYSLVSILLSRDINIIKKLRAIQPSISVVTKDDFLKLDIQIEDELIEELLLKFNND